MKIHTPQTSILEKSWYHFLMPRYSGTWFVLGLLRLTVFLPYPFIVKLGAGLGWLFRVCVPKRARIAAINLAHCFPELSEGARKKLLHENFSSVGLGILETALAWWASEKWLRKNLVVRGVENLYAAQKTGKGTLLMTGHFTTIELGIRLLALYTPLCVMYRPQNNKLFEWMLQHARKKYVQRGIVRQDVRGMIQALKEGAFICYTPDQDYGHDASVFAPFFGMMASSVTGTGRFIKKTGARVLPGFYYREKMLRKYSLNFLPLLEDFPSEDEVADATRTNQIIEEAIRQHPEQYIWQHRRFKTQPANQPAIY